MWLNLLIKQVDQNTDDDCSNDNDDDDDNNNNITKITTATVEIKWYKGLLL
jgi:hypothetical protein